MPHHHWSFICSIRARQIYTVQEIQWEVFPSSYRPADSLIGQITFALKYDGLNIEALRLLFSALSTEDINQLCDWVSTNPTSAYARRWWFLYERLTGSRLDLPDSDQGAYVPLLDPERYITAAPRRAPRQRIDDNLLGTLDFCAIVRRTPQLSHALATDRRPAMQRILSGYDPDTLARSVHYLYTKETRSTFEMEREVPTHQRAQRFVSLLQIAPGWPTLTQKLLMELQHSIADARFHDQGWRDHQNYVGDGSKIYFISPRPEDLPALMEGWLEMARRLEAGSVDAVVAAAVAAFSFVFLHPFQDGNGRIHRLLIHYFLSKLGFTPPGMILPISATLLSRMKEYDACLERFSAPLMERVEYEVDSMGMVEVLNQTAHLYTSMDLTAMVEALYGWVDQCIEKDLPEELEFMRIMREARRLLREIVDLPDPKANHLLARCLENKGKLSKTRRSRDFDYLTDAEVAAIEEMFAGLLSPADPAGGRSG